jgi:hypothetical protein
MDSYNTLTRIVYSFFGFVFFLMVCIICTYVFVGFKLVSDPGVIGRMGGEVVKGFNQTNK